MSIEKILDIAKWAPSGDNTQPWFITLQSENEFSLDLTQFKKNVYNLFSMPDLISTGMFLENAIMAAQHAGYDLNWNADEKSVQAKISKTGQKKTSPIYPYIQTRSVNRFPYKLGKLPNIVKEDLDNQLDEDIQLSWLTSFMDRLKVSKLLMLNTDIRLRLPETYAIHSHMVDWSAQDSPNKIPRSSLGANSVSTILMKWTLAKEARNKLLMKLPGSTLSFQVELDLIPALMCSGHFIMAFDPIKTPQPNIEDYIRAGQNMQRFWLTLTKNNMVMQPWYIPIMFSRYIQDGIDFTVNKKLIAKTRKLHDQFTQHILKPADINLNHVFFTGRTGFPTKTGIKRSVRKDLDDLIIAR